MAIRITSRNLGFDAKNISRGTVTTRGRYASRCIRSARVVTCAGQKPHFLPDPASGRGTNPAPPFRSGCAVAPEIPRKLSRHIQPVLEHGTISFARAQDRAREFWLVRRVRKTLRLENDAAAQGGMGA